MTTLTTVVGASAVTALAAALGALVVRARSTWPARLGWANAVASGLMLGVSYVLAEQGLQWPALATAVGAVVGILLVASLHQTFGAQDLERNLVAEQAPGYTTKIVLGTSLHAAAEGIALGVAMALHLRLGVFMAVALAVHKVAEGAVLCAVLGGQGASSTRAATVAVVSNLAAVPAAAGAFLLVGGWPVSIPWFVGFAVGTHARRSGDQPGAGGDVLVPELSMIQA
ncbi:MAG: hypothetical protein V3T72_23285 [Thermoanaerobaculia bacterium]